MKVKIILTTIAYMEVEETDKNKIMENFNNGYYDDEIQARTSESLDMNTEIEIVENEEPKQIILLKDTNDNQIDYVFNIAPGDLDKALKYRDLMRNEDKYDDYSDFEIIIDYLDKNDIEYTVSDFQGFEVKYY